MHVRHQRGRTNRLVDAQMQFAHLIGNSSQVTSVDFTEVDAQADAPDGRTVRLVAVSILELLCGFSKRESN